MAQSQVQLRAPTVAALVAGAASLVLLGASSAFTAAGGAPRDGALRRSVFFGPAGEAFEGASVQANVGHSAVAAILVGASAAAVSVALALRRRGVDVEKVIMHSAAKSPGFNTLPEWEGVDRGFEGQVGVQEPLMYWDPAGFSKDLDVEKFKRRREVEIKHGRVSMLATIGYIVPEYYKFPGYLSPSQGLKFADVPNGLAALSKVPKEGIAQWAAFIAFLELVYNKPSAEPGNYGKGNLGLGSLGLGGSITNPKERVKKLNAEMANGRLSMVAIIGMFFQDGLTGSAWGDWALYEGSPLR